jgi:hypothetical protein
MAAVALSKMVMARSEEANMAQMSSSNTNMQTKQRSQNATSRAHIRSPPQLRLLLRQGGRTRNDEEKKLEN